MATPKDPRTNLTSEELDAKIDELTSHLHHSRYLEAAEQAARLWELGVRDLRILGARLYGPFLERGLGALPEMFQRITATLTQELDEFGPQRKKIEVADSAIAWLLSAVYKQLLFHQQQKDERWQQMTSPAQRGALREALSGLGEVNAALTTIVKRPRSLGAVHRTEECLYAVSRAMGPEPPPEPPAPPAPPAEEEPKDRSLSPPSEPAPPAEEEPKDRSLSPPAEPEEPAALPQVQVRAPGAPPIVLEATPALLLLLRKLAAVETLIAREDFTRAAVVVSDVQDALEHFDPRDYFPRLFSSYSSLLARHMESIEPCLEGLESRSGKALQQLLQVDLDGFLQGGK